jgi:hypothetical protein
MIISCSNFYPAFADRPLGKDQIFGLCFVSSNVRREDVAILWMEHRQGYLVCQCKSDHNMWDTVTIITVKIRSGDAAKITRYCQQKNWRVDQWNSLIRAGILRENFLS